MTLFALLALCGGAGLALSLKPRPVVISKPEGGEAAAEPVRPAGSVPVKDQASAAEPGFATELKEAESQAGELSRRLELLEKNMARIEAERKALPEAVPAYKASRAARSLCAAAEKTVAARKKPAARRASRSVAAQPVQPRAARSLPALPGRIGSVVAAYGRNGDMMETARELNMGLAEVELALKVSDLLPSRG